MSPPPAPLAFPDELHRALSTWLMPSSRTSDGFKRLGARRRLALIERLGPKAKDDLRVGLLSPTAARQIVRLPEGNQAEVLEAVRREALTSAELAGVVDLWLGCAERRQ